MWLPVEAFQVGPSHGNKAPDRPRLQNQCWFKHPSGKEPLPVSAPFRFVLPPRIIVAPPPVRAVRDTDFSEVSIDGIATGGAPARESGLRFSALPIYQSKPHGWTVCSWLPGARNRNRAESVILRCLPIRQRQDFRRGVVEDPGHDTSR